MIREEKFTLSHRPYAVDLASLRVEAFARPDGSKYYRGRVEAVWFRRRRDTGCGPLRTVACIGELWDYQDTEPGTMVEFLYCYTDGRYGGRCEGRWDGAKYWGAQEPDVAAAHLEILRPMLAGYPAPAPGYDGWWRF